MGKRRSIDRMPPPCIGGSGDRQAGHGNDETDSDAIVHATSPRRWHNQGGASAKMIRSVSGIKLDLVHICAFAAEGSAISVSMCRFSSPAKAGDPVRRGFSVLSSESLEYWVARSSRAMTP